MQVETKIKLAGSFILVGMLAGIFSVAPSIDSAQFLTEAVENANEVFVAVLFQVILSMAYLGFAILIYPIVKSYCRSLSIGFLSFRVLAVGLSFIGTVLLLSILSVSEVYMQNNSSHGLSLDAFGQVLKITRDQVNHVFMVILLCGGNILLYILLMRAKLLASWMLVWGIAASVLSIVASVLLVMGVMDVITTEYLALNGPTALFEVFLGFWLLIKGLDIKRLENHA